MACYFWDMKKEQREDSLQGPEKSKSKNMQAIYLEVKEEKEEEEEEANISKYTNVC